MADALLDVVNTFDILDGQYNLLRLACQTPADVAALDAKYTTAQDHCEKCTNQSLADDDAEVAQLSTQLKKCNDQLKVAETQMGTMSKVLDNLTQALTIGSQLIAKLP